MKKITPILMLLFVNSASAELKWVRGPFWKTVYENNFSLQMTHSNNELNDECSYFENLVRDTDGNLTDIDNETFKMIDSMTLPGDMVNHTFQHDFKVVIPSSLAVATDLQNVPVISSLVKTEAALDVLPDYTQLPAEIRLLDQSFSNTPLLKKEANGLSKLAEKLFVNLKNPKFVRAGSNLFLRVTSKAHACDLLSGKLTLKLMAQAQVKITLDSQVDLQTGYSKIEKASIDLMTKSKNPKVRAALFGFRMGGLLESENKHDSTQIENRMLALLEQLFDADSMNPSSVWQDGFNQKTLSVSGTSAPVDVQVEIRGN